MKSLIFFLLLLPGIFSLNAQTYQVIKVAGTITNCESGDTLRIEDKIEASDSLCFTNTEDEFAIAAIISLKTENRHILKAEDSETGIQKGLVKDCLVPSRSLTGTRHGKLNTIFDMRTFLGTEDFLVLGGELVMEPNPSTLAMNADSFFFASYQYKGENINKKLEPKENLLVLNGEELFKIDGNPINPDRVSEIKLYYYRPKIRKKELVAAFHPVFPNDDEIGKELDVIIHAKGDDAKASSLKEDLVGYLVEIYGKADMDNLNAWLDTYLGESFSKE